MQNVNVRENMHPYRRFAAMVGVSTVVMFGLMYLNTYETDHIFFSQTRAWMALLMGAAMAVIMLGFMTHMLKNKALNLCIAVGSASVFAVSLCLVRSQATVDDVSYMRAMIPHHSIAIMTSKRANITDTRVRKLADSIIEAQVREIAEMESLITDLERKQKATHVKADARWTWLRGNEGREAINLCGQFWHAGHPLGAISASLAAAGC